MNTNLFAQDDEGQTDALGSPDPEIKSNYHAHLQTPMTTPGSQEQPLKQIITQPLGSRPIRMDDLYGSSEPPVTPKAINSVSGSLPDEIRTMFMFEYSRGMDLLFETEWYSKKGLTQLMQDPRLRSTFAGLLEIMRNTRPSDYEAIHKIPALESKVTWMLMCMPRMIADKMKNNHINPFSDPQLQELLYRLQIVEALICNKTLHEGFVWAPSMNSVGNPARARQLQFWRIMGGMLALPRTERSKIDGCLIELRKMLDVSENRDVLYSIAVVRHFGLAPHPQPRTLAEAAKHSRDIQSQKVAKKFIEDEAAQKGTTQVMQRICAMVVRSWAIQG